MGNKHLNYYRFQDNDLQTCYCIIPDSTWMDQIVNKQSFHCTGREQYDHGDYYHNIIQGIKFCIKIVAEQLKVSRKKMNRIFYKIMICIISIIHRLK